MGKENDFKFKTMGEGLDSKILIAVNEWSVAQCNLALSKISNIGRFFVANEPYQFFCPDWKSSEPQCQYHCQINIRKSQKNTRLSFLSKK